MLLKQRFPGGYQTLKMQQTMQQSEEESNMGSELGSASESLEEKGPQGMRKM
jgi:hypothetical protein